MDNFLKLCKFEANRLASLLQQTPSNETGETDQFTYIVVLGNESGDLDSVVSTLVYTKVLSVLNSAGSAVHLPVLNMCQKDFSLKTEVGYFLGRFQITPCHLIFRDQLDLALLRERGNLNLVLVDHNILSAADSVLENCVVEVIDHHVLERKTSSVETRILVEPVGSCCTLISSIIFQETPDILDAELATLLLGTIVLDVANFSTSAKRATSKDEEMCRQLSCLAPDISKDVIYDELLSAKEDISRLTLQELLRKDAKTICFDGWNLAVCSFPCLLATLVSKYSVELTKNLLLWCNENCCQGAVLMGIGVNRATNNIVRDIAVYSSNKDLVAQICIGLENGAPSLDLVPELDSEQTDTFACYRQGNVTASRKMVIPMLKALKLLL